MYKADILCKKQIENGKGLLTVDKLRSCWPFLLLAYLVLLIFMVLINNYGSSIKRFMPFRNSQNQELAAAFMLSLFWIVAGLLTLWAAIWQSLRVYVSAYIEEENEKKTVICWQNFQIQWIYVGLCFIFWFVVNKFLNYRFSNFEIDKYLLPLMAIIFFFLICRFIGAALLYWYIKRRTYDGL